MSESDVIKLDPQRVLPSDAISALDNLDDYSRMDLGIKPGGAVNVLLNFILQNSTPDDLTDEESTRILNFFKSEYNK